LKGRISASDLFSLGSQTLLCWRDAIGCIGLFLGFRRVGHERPLSESVFEQVNSHGIGVVIHGVSESPYARRMPMPRRKRRAYPSDLTNGQWAVMSR
jgi:hypothetical protein